MALHQEMKHPKWCAASWATESTHIHPFSPLYVNYKDLSICVQVPCTGVLWLVKIFTITVPAPHELAAVLHFASCWGMQVEDNKHISTFVFLCSWQPCNSSPWRHRAVCSRHSLAITFQESKVPFNSFQGFSPPPPDCRPGFDHED